MSQCLFRGAAIRSPRATHRRGRKEPNPSISCFESGQWWREASRVTYRAFPSAVLNSCPRFSERQTVRSQTMCFAAEHSRRASRQSVEGASTPRPRPSRPRPQGSPPRLARPHRAAAAATVRCSPYFALPAPCPAVARARGPGSPWLTAKPSGPERVRVRLARVACREGLDLSPGCRQG